MHAPPALPDSALGRLLQELSWAGSTIRNVRDGGRAHENVLTTEVLGGLDLLPREAFLGAVLRQANGSERARLELAREVEQAEVTVLPEELRLVARDPGPRGVVVQPDALVTTPSCYLLVEAKRIGGSALQPEQLAREYVAVMHSAAGRTPLLLLVLGEVPPVAVKGLGRLSPEDAVLRLLPEVLAHLGREDDLARLSAQLSQVLAWTTWHEIAAVVGAQQLAFRCSDPSVTACVVRLADCVTHAIARHAHRRTSRARAAPGR